MRDPEKYRIVPQKEVNAAFNDMRATCTRNLRRRCTNEKCAYFSFCDTFPMDVNDLIRCYIEKLGMDARKTCDRYEECDSECCIFNPYGKCLYPIIFGELPVLTEADGCIGCIPKEVANGMFSIVTR